MQFAASPHTDATPQCDYEVNNRAQGKSVAFCPTINDAIRLAMALNMLERQKLAKSSMSPIPAAPDLTKAEARCANCCHRFPAPKIGTMRITYAKQEEVQPCCPMCGEIIVLNETTTPTYADWLKLYRK